MTSWISSETDQLVVILLQIRSATQTQAEGRETFGVTQGWRMSKEVRVRIYAEE